MTILETKNLSFSYPDGTQALKDITVKIEKGKRIAFVGRNGSGKSTLFLSMNGTHRPEGGEIFFHGEPMKYNSGSLKEVRKNIGIVFQNSDDQIFAPTIYQDVAFGPTNLGYSKEEVERIVSNTLEYVGLTELKDKPPHHLSGGQKKRVAIAGIVAMDPEIMILDEPLANLDPVGADEVMDLLNELNYSGQTIIISTHDVELAYSWADYLYFLSNGRIVGQGTPEETFTNELLLKKTHLRTPMVLDIYNEIRKRGLASSKKPPTTVLDLVNSLRVPKYMSIDAPPQTQKGDSVNLGLLGGEFACEDFYDAVNAKVLCVRSSGEAIVEVSHTGLKPGGISVYDLDNYKPELFHKQINEVGVNVIGAIGKKCKQMAEDDGIFLNISSGVVEKSILMSLYGKRCLILANGKMVDYVMGRISEYVEESGIDINFSIINRN
ncbi:ATP-binding cassette domain-containing protein [uncultured Methanolobus sp.]|uniref:energy-coupling factor ABC transporter ATP-binding protein n=1 Tax=uncultured Methanolobus sp. TaxID=218300 RepID=UPI002AAB1D67|nr:ATP-binding cassette domain-containing protein [uncultured Methanolobus sp.]